jgi:hypothetical protein
VKLEFGKYDGRAINDPEVPTTYLEWLHKRQAESAEQLKAELVRREQAEAQDPNWAARLVRCGYRALAKEYSEDPDVLRELAGAKAVLEGVLEEYFDDHAPKDTVIERQRKYAQEFLNSPTADEEDKKWAHQILDNFPAPAPKLVKHARR